MRRAELSPDGEGTRHRGCARPAPPLPADGLLDGPLLQVDVVVEGGGALVIVSLQKERGGGGCHPCEPSCPSPRRGSPLSGLVRGWGLEPWRLHPAGSWLCQTLSISQPKHLPEAGSWGRRGGCSPRGHPPCGPGRCAQLSSSSAAGGCRCQISCSAGCTRGSPARACCRGTDNGLSTRPLSTRSRLGAKIPPPNQPRAKSLRPGRVLAGVWPCFCLQNISLGCSCLQSPKNKLLVFLLPLHPSQKALLVQKGAGKEEPGSSRGKTRHRGASAAGKAPDQSLRGSPRCPNFLASLGRE